MRLTLALISALTFAPLADLHSATEAIPNILVFLADDWGRNASCYRDPARASVNDVIETPNIYPHGINRQVRGIMAVGEQAQTRSPATQASQQAFARARTRPI